MTRVMCAVVTGVMCAVVTGVMCAMVIGVMCVVVTGVMCVRNLLLVKNTLSLNRIQFSLCGVHYRIKCPANIHTRTACTISHLSLYSRMCVCILGLLASTPPPCLSTHCNQHLVVPTPSTPVTFRSVALQTVQ